MDALRIIKAMWLLSFILIFAALIYLIVYLAKWKSISLNENSLTPSSVISNTNHSIVPIISNQWYSSLYNSFPSQPLFAFPLAYKISSSGLSFSSPDIKKTASTIFAPYNEDFTIGTSSSLGKPKIASVGDWNINLEMSSNNGDKISFFLAHGIPYTIIHARTDNLQVKFADSANVVSQDTGWIVVSVRGHNYIFVLPTKKTITVTGRKIDFGNTPSLLVGLLDDPAHADLFIKQLNNDLISTSASPTSEGGKPLFVKYSLMTTNEPTLVALFPHQYENLTSKLSSIGSYKTLRGTLKLYNLSTFETQVPLTINPSEGFLPLQKSHADLTAQLKKDIDQIVREGPPSSRDYGLGTWFGKATSLIQLADTLRDNDSKNRLLVYIKPIFIKSLSYFSYSKVTTSVIAKFPEYGNEKNNDHHFHYGYYIRTAAVLAKYDPAILSSIQGSIDQMVTDIANIDKASDQYPYLRNFDIYESHSWADGAADFADGNNQESTSEAINAWYGVYLWSEITNNPDLEKYALYLYNSEIQGAQYYWFNKDKIYNAPYAHAIASIVWGGKVDFATWFSAETNMKYGIELLPITPASDYLSTFSNFNKYDQDFHASGGSESKSWGDLFLSWKSFYNPAAAIQSMYRVTQFESAHPKSLFLYTLYKNNKE